MTAAEVIGPPHQRRAWTLNEVARSLGVTRPTVKKWVDEGELLAVRFGSVQLVPDRALRERLGEPEPPTDSDFEQAVLRALSALAERGKG